MLKKITDFLNDVLRINAIRRMLTIVDIKRTRDSWTGLASRSLFAIFEGIGLSLLLPILQYAEGAAASPETGGKTAILASSGPFWRALSPVLDFLHLPVTLPVLLALAFIPILLRQVVFYFNTWYSAVVSGRIGSAHEGPDSRHGALR